MYVNDLNYHEISEVAGLGENCLRMRIRRLNPKILPDENYCGIDNSRFR